MKNPPALLGLVLLVLPLACVSARQDAPLPDQRVELTRPDVTRIYFVRDDDARMMRREVVVHDGEREIGALTPGTFLCWERPGGRTLGSAAYQSIDSTQGRIEGLVDLDCTAGRVHYFNVTVDRETGKPTVVPLDAARGKKLVAERSPAGGS